MHKTITLRFHENFPDSDYAGEVVVLDPWDGEGTLPKRMWRLGRETEVDQFGCDITFHKSRFLSRTQCTIKFDASDLTWHIHDGLLVDIKNGPEWMYSTNDTYLNDVALKRGDWEPLQFADLEGRPISPRISFGLAIDAKIIVTASADETLDTSAWNGWGNQSEPPPPPTADDVALLNGEKTEIDNPWEAIYEFAVNGPIWWRLVVLAAIVLVLVVWLGGS